MKRINAEVFKAMLKSGAANLSNNQREIDALNVFPVPDGDTGTNMTMTFDNGYKEAMAVYTASVSDVAKALSKGLLMGARGNSGVITSQIFRGFYQAIDGKKEIDVKDVALAFENGSAVAYKAIMKPVEGTILTVIREASWYAANELKGKPKMNMEEYFSVLVQYANTSLASTPDLLPALKETGVVDSGGCGLVKILEGFLASLKGEDITVRDQGLIELTNAAVMSASEEGFGYCTEFIIRLSPEYNNRKFDENILKNKLASLGESLVLVKDDDIIKVHVHTLKPGDALNAAQRYGEFIKLKIENMQEQHSNLISESSKKSKEHKKYGLITVAAGQGLQELFYELRADVVISGGQTMNPSTENFLEKIDELDNCENIFIFPNNSNIILAAQQACSIVDRKVIVIPTKSIQQGLSAIGMFNPEASVEDNERDLNEIINNMETGSLTYAIKNTSFDGIEVKEGDYIAMTNKQIVSAGKDMFECIKVLLDKMLSAKEDAELLTLICGEDADEEVTKKIIEYVEENSEVELEEITGDQPVYAYLFGLE